MWGCEGTRPEYPAAFCMLYPTTSDETWVRDLSEAGATHHFALGKMRKDCWVTERQGLLLLIILCICGAGTVVQSAPGGSSLEVLAGKILKPGINVLPLWQQI